MIYHAFSQPTHCVQHHAFITLPVPSAPVHYMQVIHGYALYYNDAEGKSHIAAIPHNLRLQLSQPRGLTELSNADGEARPWIPLRLFLRSLITMKHRIVMEVFSRLFKSIVGGL